MSSDNETSSPRNDPTAENRLLSRFVKTALALAAVGCAALIVASSMVFVDEGEYVLVERLGDIVAVYDHPDDRGLKFKLPWPIDTTRRFDRRVRLFNPPGREVFTSDKKNITVSAYVCWKIAEPQQDTPGDAASRPVVRFYRNLASPAVAEARLDSRVRSLLNTELGRIELAELLSVGDSHVGPRGEERGLLAKIADDVRSRLQRGRDGKPALTDELGIEIVDLRIRRINFPAGNRQAVYDRMRSERKREADRYRAEGFAANKVIQSRADLQYKRALSRAEADAERIRGEARARSIEIRNKAQARDPEFYLALRTLQTYKQILNEKTTLVLSASSRLLKMLTDGIPDAKLRGEKVEGRRSDVGDPGTKPRTSIEKSRVSKREPRP